MRVSRQSGKLRRADGRCRKVAERRNTRSRVTNVRSKLQIWVMRIGLLAAILAVALAVPSVSRAQVITSENIGVHPDLLKQVRFDEQLGHTIPLNLTFR